MTENQYTTTLWQQLSLFLCYRKHYEHADDSMMRAQWSSNLEVVSLRPKVS